MSRQLTSGVLGRKKGNPLLEFLVAGYRLDGDANDIRGLNNGTPTNVTWVSDAERGTVVQLSGDGYIDTGFERYDGVGLFCDAGEAFSVSIWGKTSNDGTFIARAQSSHTIRSFQLFIQNSDNGTPGLFIRGLIYSTDLGANDGNWHHHAATWDGSVLKYYLDGEFVTNISVGSAAEDTGQRIIIGARTNGTGFYINGLISDTYIFKKALTEDEIQLAMNGL
jgi:hypothetical protein